MSNSSDNIVSPSSGPSDELAEINLEEYLSKYIDGYLIGDLDNLTNNKDIQISKYCCSFVIILTICAGIEFLGLLLNPDEEVANKKTIGRNRKCFSYYWDEKLNDKYKNAICGDDAYNLIRNGLAHCFMVKSGIGTIRKRPDEHLKISLNNGTRVLKIDADYFFEDFRKSYMKAKETLLDDGKGEKLATSRLNYQALILRKCSTNFIERLNQTS